MADIHIGDEIREIQTGGMKAIFHQERIYLFFNSTSQQL
jgi:hypothetical protein